MGNYILSFIIIIISVIAFIFGVVSFINILIVLKHTIFSILKLIYHFISNTRDDSDDINNSEDNNWYNY
jgi:hypothetical protein